MLSNAMNFGRNLLNGGGNGTQGQGGAILLELQFTIRYQAEMSVSTLGNWLKEGSNARSVSPSSHSPAAVWKS